MVGSRQSYAVLELLMRRESPAQLLAFFQSLAEHLAVSFADSARAAPGRNRPMIQARGNLRRAFMDDAFRKAAANAGIAANTGTTIPPTWSYPIARLGTFSISLGVVDRHSSRSARRLRSRGEYVRNLVARNAALNPQSSLFGVSDAGVPTVIPKGAFGALVVVEASVRVPDAPVYMGLMVPSANLKASYYQVGLDSLIRMLRDKIAETKTPKRRAVERKKPKLRVKPRAPKQG